MLARIARYEVEPERTGEALDAFRDAAQQIGELDGMRGGYVLVDAEVGLIISITLWEDAVAMEKSEVRASRLRQEAVRPVEGTVEAVERLSVEVEIGAAVRTD